MKSHIPRGSAKMRTIFPVFTNIRQYVGMLHECKMSARRLDGFPATPWAALLPPTQRAKAFPGCFCRRCVPAPVAAGVAPAVARGCQVPFFSWLEAGKVLSYAATSSSQGRDRRYVSIIQFGLIVALSYSGRNGSNIRNILHLKDFVPAT